MEVDWQPERYQLSQGLASLLGIELDTRARVIEVRSDSQLTSLQQQHAFQKQLNLPPEPGRTDAHAVIDPMGADGVLGARFDCWHIPSHDVSARQQAVWSYIRRYKCQSPGDPTRVACNARLKALFEEDSVEISSLSERLSKHLSPAPAATLDFTVRYLRSDPRQNFCYRPAPGTMYMRLPVSAEEIRSAGGGAARLMMFAPHRVSGPSPSTPDCYDIDVELPTVPQPRVPEAVATPEADSQLAKVRQVMARTGFSASPVLPFFPHPVRLNNGICTG